MPFNEAISDRVRRQCRFWAMVVVILGMGNGQLLGGEPSEAASGSEAQHGFLIRHIRIDQWELGSRYRYMDRLAGVVTDRDMQLKSSVKLRIGLWKKLTSVNLRAETGSSFTSSWSCSGIGMQKQALAFNVKSLYLSQKLGKNLEAQVGGIEFDQGAGTEATYADNDGWLTGYRLGVSGWKKAKWSPDRVGVTVGYIGDFKMPNVFARLHRVAEPNYVQVIAAKKLGRQQVSAEFDSIQRIEYFRPAIRIGGVLGPVIDEAMVEAVIRGNEGARAGWSATMNKRIGEPKRWTAYITVSDIPVETFRKGNTDILLNGDSMALGKRVGTGIRFVPAANLELSIFGSRRLETTNLAPRWRGQFMVRYQLGDAINKALR
jgi:hypothetical protein